MQNIAILTYNNAALFELGCAVELFALPRPEVHNWYRAEVVTLDAGPHHSSAGLQLIAKQVTDLDAYQTLVIPSWPTNITHVKDPLAKNIRQFQDDGKRILSFCSGAFLLAALGMLDGKKATTHWRYAELLKRRYPKIDYVSNVLYVFDGQVGCSAGSAAALDLGLEVIRSDFGQTVAKQVSRRLVIAAHRKGGQAQFTETPPPKTSDHFSAAMEWATANLGQPFTITTLANKANMSRRTFDRKFRRYFDQTAKQWLTDQRLNLAKELLESDTRNIDQIAALAGFDNATTMRHHFRLQLGLSPRQYRDQFAA